ncbi:MAG TPA: DNA topoisomerase IV subunit A [Candidatus Methanomethylophilaceae archaeon]|nr:DNA topoisomerase IV subunit A [Candidatus Methanomethylophilaceae archaeon]
MTGNNKETMESLTKIVDGIYNNLNDGEVPSMRVALRSKKNIEFNPKSGVWNYGDLKSTRTAKTVKGSLMLLRTVYTADFIKSMLETKKSSTLREMYYISEGWSNAKFGSQGESVILAEDLEILTGHMREDFKLRPEEDGARIYGDLTLTELTRKGERKKINCMDDVGDSGYGIPYNVGPEKIEFKDFNSKFVVAVETGGMFDRLVENGFPERYDALLVHLKGQPTRGTRRFIKRLNDELNLPVTVFTDGDPWSFRIFASVAYGAIKTAHISEHLATPTAQFIGITPSDILNYDLPTDVLTDKDKGALRAELSDPRFKDEFWENEIRAMLDIGKKAEQQALAKYGLDFVTDTYLPEKLTEMSIL